jgi:hypothetical protein
MTPNAYCSIPLLCCMGKVVEEVVAEWLAKEAERRRLHSDGQYGSRKRRLAIDMAAIIVNWTPAAWREGHIVGVLLIDIMVVFPSIWRGRMIHTMRGKGINGVLIRWMASFLTAWTSVSNGSGWPASGPGLHRKNGSVRFQNHPKARLAGSWWAKPRPVPVNLRILPGPARPVGSDLRFCVSGFLFIVTFRNLTANRKIVTLVRDCSFRVNWLPLYLKMIQTCSLSHLENECQWCVNNYWYWILVIYKATAYKHSIMR